MHNKILKFRRSNEYRTNIIGEIMVEVTIDQDMCTGCGTCEALCGDVYELDEAGLAQLVEEYRGDDPTTGTVPDDVDCTETGAESCPVDAISVE